MVVYLLGGIALASEFPLPELPLAGEETEHIPHVNIRRGAVPLALPGSIELDPDCFATSTEYLLRVRGVAHYLVSHGREIVVQPEDDALALDMRAYLLATIFVVLCHQRGLLPLHASAVLYSGCVVAFLAPSGQGKSSVAAHLARRGFQVVADDICLVEMQAGGPATVTPVAPWLKLWRASLQQLGQTADDLERVFSEDDKYRLPLQTTALEDQRYPIGKLVFLERRGETPNGSFQPEVEITEVPRIQALPMLMNLTHQAYLLDAMDKREQNFVDCGRVVSQAAAYRLIRPWGFNHMESAIDSIESFLRTL